MRYKIFRNFLLGWVIYMCLLSIISREYDWAMLWALVGLLTVI